MITARLIKNVAYYIIVYKYPVIGIAYNIISHSFKN